MNEERNKYIKKDEIQQLLNSFQKGKSPGLDGFTLEFFLRFYDKIKEDILEMIKESKKLGKVLGSIN